MSARGKISIGCAVALSLIAFVVSPSLAQQRLAAFFPAPMQKPYTPIPVSHVCAINCPRNNCSLICTDTQACETRCLAGSNLAYCRCTGPARPN